MRLSELMLPEFDQEMANTRRMLERIPDDRLDFKPHEKSMALVGLATHLSNMPKWVVMVMKEESFDMAPAGGEPVREDPVRSVAGALEAFDRNAAAARAAIAETGDDDFMAPWTLLAGGNPVFKMPRYSVVRTTIINHMIHHRAQLGVYLRLNDIPVPAIYGPTADGQEPA